MQFGRDLDGVANRAGHRTEIGMEAVDSFRGVALVALYAFEHVCDMDTFDYQDFALFFDLAGRFRDQVPVRCVDAARLQRAPEGSRQSTAGGGDDVVNRRGVRRVFLRVDTVMLGDGSVHSEADWLIQGRHPYFANRTSNPFDLDF